MENSTPQFISADTRDYSRKIGIADIIGMTKAIELRKAYYRQYWLDFGRI